MDPRHIEVHAMGEPTDEELARPPMWRFWRKLPRRGNMGIFFGSWYTAPIVDRVYRRIGGEEMNHALAQIARFERMLVDEGALVLKLWLHLTRKGQRKVFERRLADPATAWQVTKEDWRHHARYDRFRTVSERALRETSTAEAPWTVIEATDPRYRDLTVARTLLDAIHARLAHGKPTPPVRAAPPPAPPIDARNVVEELDLSKALTATQYERRLPRLQGRLNALSRDKRFRERACVVVFEHGRPMGESSSASVVATAS